MQGRKLQNLAKSAEIARELESGVVGRRCVELRLKEGLLVAINVNGVGLVSMRVTDGSGWYRLTERSDHAFLRLSELRPFTYEVL